jgi:predicted small secreted protein
VVLTLTPTGLYKMIDGLNVEETMLCCVGAGAGTVAVTSTGAWIGTFALACETDIKAVSFLLTLQGLARIGKYTGIFITLFLCTGTMVCNTVGGTGTEIQSGSASNSSDYHIAIEKIGGGQITNFTLVFSAEWIVDPGPSHTPAHKQHKLILLKPFYSFSAANLPAHRTAIKQTNVQRANLKF